MFSQQVSGHLVQQPSKQAGELDAVCEMSLAQRWRWMPDNGLCIIIEGHGSESSLQGITADGEGRAVRGGKHARSWGTSTGSSQESSSPPPGAWWGEQPGKE